MREVIVRKALLTAALVVGAASLVAAQGARTVHDGVYSDAQAARGQALYGSSARRVMATR